MANANVWGHRRHAKSLSLSPLASESPLVPASVSNRQLDLRPNNAIRILSPPGQMKAHMLVERAGTVPRNIQTTIRLGTPVAAIASSNNLLPIPRP